MTRDAPTWQEIRARRDREGSLPLEESPAYNNELRAIRLGRLINSMRTESGLTQQELASRMGSTQPAIAKLESGRTTPTIPTLQKVADATGRRVIIGALTDDEIDKFGLTPLVADEPSDVGYTPAGDRALTYKIVRAPALSYRTVRTSRRSGRLRSVTKIHGTGGRLKKRRNTTHAQTLIVGS